MPDDCVFCKIVAGEIPSTKVYETDEVLAFEDLHPSAPTHVLIIPKKHVENVAGLTEEDTALAGKLLLAARAIAEEQGRTDFRLITNTGESAGQSVFHLHFHLLAGRHMGWPPG